jgi:acyl-CoA thioester hydrolase
MTRNLHAPVLTYKSAIHPWHCDHAGHMNSIWYVSMFHDATWNLFRLIGLTSSHLSQAQRRMTVVDQHITYLNDAQAGSAVCVYSNILDIHKDRLVLKHDMRNQETGIPLARTTLTATHIDSHTRHLCSLSADVIAEAHLLLRHLHVRETASK